MIRLDAAHLLMIEPTGAPSAEPLIDHLTRKMVGALADARPSDVRYRGVHTCTGRGCEAHSDNTEHFVAARGGELTTNSLAVHYLARHRADVPAAELAKVETLLASELEPTAHQLSGRWEDRRDRDLLVTRGDTGLRTSTLTTPVRVDRMTVTGRGAIGIDLDDDAKGER